MVISDIVQQAINKACSVSDALQWNIHVSTRRARLMSSHTDRE